MNYFVGGNNIKRPMLMWRSRIVFKLKRFRREWKKLGCKRKFFPFMENIFSNPNWQMFICLQHQITRTNNQMSQWSVQVILSHKRVYIKWIICILHQHDELYWDLDFDIYISLIYFPTAHNQRDQPKCKIINQPDWHKLWQE